MESDSDDEKSLLGLALEQPALLPDADGEPRQTEVAAKRPRRGAKSKAEAARPIAHTEKKRATRNTKASTQPTPEKRATRRSTRVSCSNSRGTSAAGSLPSTPATSEAPAARAQHQHPSSLRVSDLEVTHTAASPAPVSAEEPSAAMASGSQRTAVPKLEPGGPPTCAPAQAADSTLQPPRPAAAAIDILASAPPVAANRPALSLNGDQPGQSAPPATEQAAPVACADGSVPLAGLATSASEAATAVAPSQPVSTAALAVGSASAMPFQQVVPVPLESVAANCRDVKVHQVARRCGHPASRFLLAHSAQYKAAAAPDPPSGCGAASAEPRRPQRAAARPTVSYAAMEDGKQQDARARRGGGSRAAELPARVVMDVAVTPVHWCGLSPRMALPSQLQPGLEEDYAGVWARANSRAPVKPKPPKARKSRPMSVPLAALAPAAEDESMSGAGGSRRAAKRSLPASERPAASSKRPRVPPGQPQADPTHTTSQDCSPAALAAAASGPGMTPVSTAPAPMDATPAPATPTLPAHLQMYEKKPAEMAEHLKSMLKFHSLPEKWDALDKNERMLTYLQVLWHNQDKFKACSVLEPALVDMLRTHQALSQALLPEQIELPGAVKLLEMMEQQGGMTSLRMVHRWWDSFEKNVATALRSVERNSSVKTCWSTTWNKLTEACKLGQTRGAGTSKGMQAAVAASLGSLQEAQPLVGFAQYTQQQVDVMLAEERRKLTEGMYTKAQLDEAVAAATAGLLTPEQANTQAAKAVAAATARLLRPEEVAARVDEVKDRVAREAASRAWQKACEYPCLQACAVADEERNTAMLLIAMMLAPEAELANRVQGIEDALFNATSENGRVGQQYRLQLSHLIQRMLPQGVPELWMPSKESEDALTAVCNAIKQGEEPPSYQPDMYANPTALQAAKQVRGDIWSGQLSAIAFATGNTSDSP